MSSDTFTAELSLKQIKETQKQIKQSEWRKTEPQ
jgi:translation initiation factor 2 alpha subunit (eIF-2alpha)